MKGHAAGCLDPFQSDFAPKDNSFGWMRSIPYNFNRGWRLSSFEAARDLLAGSVLTVTERRVLTAIYLCDMNFSRAALNIGINRMAVRRIHDDALGKLRVQYGAV